MSEYQYYEFLAIGRPLTEDEMAELRALSTRATITPVSFTNYYNWGDFKGNPGKLMQRYFDAHVYVANWMTAIFMVRLPIEALPKETVKAMAVPYMLDIKATKSHWIITWSLEESENYDRFGMEDGRGWMARLAPVRDELLRGDMRSLYIGWLAGAVMGSPAAQSEEISEKDMDRWIDDLPRNEVKAVLKQLLEGKGHLAERSIKNQFAAWRRGLQTDKIDLLRRTVGELRKNAEKARQIRLEKQKRDRKRREIKRREKRKAYLKNLSNDFLKAWESVREPVERIGAGV
jgi:Skp family chaperone for outer membrane proteins